MHQTTGVVMPTSTTTPNEPARNAEPLSAPVAGPTTTREPPVSDGSWGLLAVPMMICLFLMLYVII